MAKRKFVVKKSVTMRKAYRSWNEYSVGDIVIGEFSGTHLDQYQKSNPVVKVLDLQWKDAKAAKEVADKYLVLNSTGMIDKAFEGMEQGTIVQVEYCGTSTIEKGKYKGKESHTFQINVVEEESDEIEENEEDYL